MSLLIPTVKYHTVFTIDEDQRLFESTAENCIVNNVVKVINGSLESVLHLIGYSFTQIKQINRQLAIKYSPEQNQEFELSYTERQMSNMSADIVHKRPSRPHILQFEDHLYAVIVDRGVARICGQISQVIPKTLKTTQISLFMRGHKISGNGGNVEKLSRNEEVRKHIDSGHHIVIVSEKGSLSVVPNDDTTGHQYDKKVTLILGIDFVFQS